MYGLPYELYVRHGIRRYGFHGTSHKYPVGEAAKMLGKPIKDTNLITCHLGEIDARWNVIPYVLSPFIRLLFPSRSTPGCYTI